MPSIFRIIKSAACGIFLLWLVLQGLNAISHLPPARSETGQYIHMSGTGLAVVAWVWGMLVSWTGTTLGLMYAPSSDIVARSAFRKSVIILGGGWGTFLVFQVVLAAVVRTQAAEYFIGTNVAIICVLAVLALGLSVRARTSPRPSSATA